MAVKKFNFLDESGVQTLATHVLKGANTRIKERIIDSTTGITAGSYTDDQHVLSAKVLLGLIGKIDDFDTTIDGSANTVLDKIKAIKNAIGTKTDLASVETVYGAIAKAKEDIAALTNLSYKVVEGAIEVAVPTGTEKKEIIYLQHDNPGYKVGRDGYLLAEGGEHAKHDAGEGEYEAYQNPDTKKIYKSIGSVVQSQELLEGDPIFDKVAKVEDKTYNLYIWNDDNWICVGDTSIDLANYWSRNDASVEELKNLLFAPMGESAITDKVSAAFTATNPFDPSSSANAYQP